MAVELDSAISRSSILAMAILTAVRCCSCRTSWVIAAVTLGLPSRSPPIQLPSSSGVASGESSTPCVAIAEARSSVSSGMVSATIGSR